MCVLTLEAQSKDSGLLSYKLSNKLTPVVAGIVSFAVDDGTKVLHGTVV